MAVTNDERNNAILREMQRTSLDLIRIYNPTDDDFTILWDGFKHVVPSKDKDVGYGKGMRVVQRYLAEWYKKHMTDKMINDKQDMKLAQLKEKYDKAGVEDGLLKANLELERNRGMRTDNEEEVRRISAIIWLGIEERFGMDNMIENEGDKIDRLSVHEKVSEELKNKMYVKPQDVPAPASSFPINKAKKKLIEEVSV